VVPDPARKGEPFPGRRKRLGEAGKKLAPGSGVKCPDPAKPGACEGGHVEGVLWRDVLAGTTPYRRYRGSTLATPFTRAAQLKRTNRAQRNAAIAMNGRFGAIAFEE